jgi:O-antigen ligase
MRRFVQMRFSHLLRELELPDWRYGLGLFAAIMLYFWHPFSGGARAPSAVLFLLGLWFWATAWRSLAADQTQRRWLFIVACLAIPNLLSLATSYSAEHTLNRIGLVFLTWVVGSVLIEVLRQPGALRLLKTVLAVTVAIWIFDGLVQMLVGFDLLGIPKAGEGVEARVVGLYGNHLYLPWSLTLGLPVLVWALIPTRPFLALLALALGGILIVGTGVRSALLAWFIVVLFATFNLKLRRKWLMVAALVASLALGISLSPLAKVKFQQTKLEGFSFEQVDTLLSARLYLWETAWHMVKDRPVLGVGGDSFRAAYENYSTREDDPFTNSGWAGSQNVHQLYLSVLAETGFVGLAGLLLAMGFIGRVSWMAAPAARKQAAPYAVGLIAVTFPLNSQPLIYKTWWIPLLALFVAAILTIVCCGSDEVDEK